jgi:tol-pal system protein YbgF
MTVRRHSRLRRLARAAAPALFLLTGACFATRTDVRVLQGDLNNVRAEMARNDAARAAQLTQLIATLEVLNDSLRAASNRIARFQGDTKQELFAVRQDLVTIQSLTGQTQDRLQRIRAEIEQARAEAAAAPAGDSASGGPGPSQLLQMGRDNLNRRSAGAARTAFQELLTRFPSSDLAADAQFQIAEAYQQEGNTAAADSVYRIVETQYPQAPQAATALYKRALSLIRAGNTRQGRTALEQVVQRFPRSDEAELARNRLKTLR